MDMLDKRLNDKGKNWRHVLKSLKVLDYCLHEGSELVVTWARKNIYIIKTLREFMHVDDEGRDVGASSKTRTHLNTFVPLLIYHSPRICEGVDIVNSRRGAPSR
jgi:epsin